jgi:SAM-dependent methyltransferase
MDSQALGTEDRQGGSRRSAERVVPLVIEITGAQTVVDLGCGPGDWLAEFARHGAAAILGVDGPWVPATAVRIPKESFVGFDLCSPFQSERRFDLAVCLEVAEHLPASCADTLVDSLIGLAPVVLFSAAIPGQGGLHHLNEQWPDYWIERFRQRRYAAIDCLRPRIWELLDVDWWYCQNMLLFVAEEHLQRQERLRGLAAGSPPPLALVHPRLFVEAAARPSITSLRQVLRALPSLVVARISSGVARLLGLAGPR